MKFLQNHERCFRVPAPNAEFPFDLHPIYGNDCDFMKRYTTLFLFSAALFFGAIFSNADGNAPGSRNLAPFAEEILSEGARLSPDVLGNFSETRNVNAGNNFSFKFDIDYFKNIPAFSKAIFAAALNCVEETAAPEIAARNFIADATSALAEPGESDGEFSFFISAKVATPVDKRVSVLIFRYEDSGGAHGNSVFSCLNFDLAKEKQIFLKDIFKPESVPELEKILQKHDPRRKDDEFSYSKEPEEIPLPPYATENFLILPDGFLFIYSPYELDCYAAGTVRIFVPAAELRELLK